jgi:mono/diheme cytochrome c family protein
MVRTATSIAAAAVLVVVVTACGGSKAHEPDRIDATRLKATSVKGLCRGIARTGRGVTPQAFTEAQICAAVGPPNEASSDGTFVAWGYPAGGTVLFKRGRGVEVFTVRGFDPLRHPPARTVAPGREVLLQSGCLACHRLDEEGNNGPGPPLTHIGARLAPAAIAQTLRNPTSPMPSFANLPKAKFDALVAYLAQLR